MKVLFWIVIVFASALFIMDMVQWSRHRLTLDIHVPFFSELSLLMCAWAIHLMRISMQPPPTPTSSIKELLEDEPEDPSS